MWYGFIRALSNTSVNKKLALGFGLVILLTLITATISGMGLFQTIERSEKVAEITRIDGLIRELTNTQTIYHNERSDSLLEELNQILTTLSDLQNNVRNLFVDPQDLEWLNAQHQLLEHYKAQLEPLSQSYQARWMERFDVLDKGSSIDRAVKSLQSTILADTLSDTATQMRNLKSTTSIDQAVADARIQAASYVSSNGQSLRQATLTAIGNIERAVKRLNEESGNSALTQAVSQQIGGYRSSVERYSEAVDKGDVLSMNMRENLNRIIELSQLLTQSQQDKREKGLTKDIATLSITSVLALIFGISAAWIINRQVVPPLQRMVEVASQIADGKLTDDVDVNRDDEIGQLQRSMQRMVLNLRDLIGQIHSGVSQLTSAAEELSAVTEQTSAGVNSQKVETDQVATAMNEMAATVQEVARNAEFAATAATAADLESREGEQVIGHAVSQMDKLAIEVVRSSEAVDQLTEQSQQIGSVLDVIKAVADQTNLLALNAAIEAARAGDAGRGFAVVADEVRSLAQRTQKSTEEIESLISTLQDRSAQATSLMQSSQSLTQATLALSQEAGLKLSSIAKSVSEIQAMNQQIAAAAEQQGTVAEEVNRSVMNVRDISEQTATASAQTASSSMELARLGTVLQQSVSRFHL